MLIWEGGPWGYALIYIFFYHTKHLEHNNWSGKCGNGAKRYGIWNLGIEAPKIWNHGIEAQQIWNQGIEAQKNLESEIWLPLIHPPPHYRTMHPGTRTGT